MTVLMYGKSNGNGYKYLLRMSVWIKSHSIVISSGLAVVKRELGARLLLNANELVFERFTMLSVSGLCNSQGGLGDIESVG